MLDINLGVSIDDLLEDGKEVRSVAKYRKGISIENATEDELIRWQMERIVREAERIDIDKIGECSSALASLYDSLKYRHTRTLLGIMISLYLLICSFVLIVQLFRRE